MKPGSSRRSIEIVEGALVIKLRSQPVEGKANAELVETLSEILDIPKSLIEIKSGSTSKTKTVFCLLAADDAEKRINEKISNH